MSNKTWPVKADPQDVADWTIIWTLDPGDTIVGSVWSIIDGSGNLAILTDTITNTPKITTSVWLTGGAVNDFALLLNHITTAQGRQFDQTVKLKIKQR